jgi:hypothetical protein
VGTGWPGAKSVGQVSQSEREGRSRCLVARGQASARQANQVKAARRNVLVVGVVVAPAGATCQPGRPAVASWWGGVVFGTGRCHLPARAAGCRVLVAAPWQSVPHGKAAFSVQCQKAPHLSQHRRFRCHRSDAHRHTLKGLKWAPAGLVPKASGKFHSPSAKVAAVAW